MRIRLRRLGQNLILNDNARFYVHVVIWFLLGVILFGRGVHGIFPTEPSTIPDYAGVTFTPGATTVWHHAAIHGSGLWSYAWGLWFLLFFLLPIHLVVAFIDELRIGYERIREEHERRSVVERSADTTTTAPTTKSSSPGGKQQGALRGRTIFELLEVEVLAQFIGEIIGHIWLNRKKEVPS